MKKLLLAMGCFAAMIVISSCSADSLEEVKKENLMYPPHQLHQSIKF